MSKFWVAKVRFTVQGPAPLASRVEARPLTPADKKHELIEKGLSIYEESILNSIIRSSGLKFADGESYHVRPWVIFKVMEV